MNINTTKTILVSSLLCFNIMNLNAQQHKTIEVVVPDAPKVQAIVPMVSVKTLNSSQYNDKSNIKIIKELNSTGMIGSSKRVPPNYNKKEKVVIVKDAKAGEINNARVSAYLQTAYIPKKDLISKLEKAGFKILSEFKVDKKGKILSIIFTDDAMTKQASKNSRGFAASLRVLFDTKNKQTSISNPFYTMKAFMQDDFDEKVASATLNKLHSTFDDLKNSKDIVRFSSLRKYHFMENMPYYNDMIEISTGKNEQLLKKAKKSKKLVFEQKLSNGSILIGVKLSKRTSKFVKKIGYQNSGLLPYPILIEDGKAKMLDPKFYIAVMYPLLSMSEFMTIATVPGAIQKDCDRVFR